MEDPSPEKNFTMSEFIPRGPDAFIDMSAWSLRSCATTHDEKRGRIVFDAVMMPGEHPVRFRLLSPKDLP